MEAIKNIKNESPMKPETITGSDENHPAILTAEAIEKHFSGEKEILKLTSAIDSLTEYYITDWFHYNQLELINNDLKVCLIDNYRREDFRDNLRFECIPDYNPLLNLIGDAENYFNTEKYNYNPYYPDRGDETLDFLTYTILTDYLEAENLQEITTKQILNIIHQQDETHQEIIRTANYTELLKDLQEAYKKLVAEYLHEAEEALTNKFYDEIYFPYMEQAEQDIITEYINTPIKNIQ